MKTLFAFLLVALIAGVAMAQLNPPLPSNIVQVGPVNFMGADGTLTFDSREINGLVRKPSGIYAWSAAPFRYRAYFASGDADTIGALLAPVPADTVISDMRGDVQYPVFVVLPGANALAVDLGDTVWARAYYTE